MTRAGFGLWAMENLNSLFSAVTAQYICIASSLKESQEAYLWSFSMSSILALTNFWCGERKNECCLCLLDNSLCFKSKLCNGYIFDSNLGFNLGVKEHEYLALFAWTASDGQIKLSQASVVFSSDNIIIFNRYLDRNISPLFFL